MKRYVPWIAAAVIISAIFVTMATLVQQSLRDSANDPQIQLAEDAATALRIAEHPQEIPQVQGTITIGSTLNPFVIVYNQQGVPVAGNGYLDGQLGRIPAGSLKAASNKPYSSVTWQPAHAVRIAAVTVKAGAYYVLSGRSLQEVEKREAKTMQLTALGWMFALGVLAAACAYNKPWLLKH